MDGKKWQDRWIGPVRETLEKLSPAQRLSLGVLGASLLVGLGTLALGGSSGKEMALVSIADVAEAQEFASWLEKERIDAEVTPNGVAVAQSDLPYVRFQSRMLHAQGNRPDFFKYIDEDESVTTSNRARSDRWSVGNKRQLEDDLRRSDGIRDARVTFTPDRRRTALLRRDLGGGAAIHLEIDENVYAEGRLPGSVARVVGQHVAAALGLNLERISVMDNRGNGYDLSAKAVMAGGDDDPVARIRANISDLVENSFPIGTFAVVVDVKRNLRPSAIVEESVDPDNKVNMTKRKVTETSKNLGSVGAPGLKPNVARLGEGDARPASASDSYERTETDFDNAWGRREVRTDVPAGELEGVTISLEIDMATAVGILEETQRLLKNPDWSAKGEELDAALKVFQEEWRLKLEQHSSLEPNRVKAQVDFSVRPRAAETASIGSDGRGMLAWLGEHAGSLVLVVLSLAGGAFLVRAARSGITDVGDLPDPVAELEQFLARREERIAAQAAKRQEVELERSTRETWNVEAGDQGTIDLLEDVIRYAQEQPQVAASVVKQWLREPSGRSPEKGGSTS